MHGFGMHSYNVHDIAISYIAIIMHIAIRYVATLYVAIINKRMFSEMFSDVFWGCFGMFSGCFGRYFLDVLGMVGGSPVPEGLQVEGRKTNFARGVAGFGVQPV